MSKHPFFSVIMPAHNAAAYILKGLNSVKQQSFTDYELIVICDACSDHTAEIARQYADQVYEVDYKSPGLTRNVGLDHANGDWVIFLDDDDWFLHEFCFQQLHDKVAESRLDLLNFSWIWKGTGYIQNTKENPKGQVCGHLWRRSFIGDTRFADILFTEDQKFFCDLMQKDPLVEYWDMPMYYYNFGRTGSICWCHGRRRL